MIVIECEICGAYTEMKEPPKNNFCPCCCSMGSLFIQDNPTDVQLKKLEGMRTNETAI